MQCLYITYENPHMRHCINCITFEENVSRDRKNAYQIFKSFISFAMAYVAFCGAIYGEKRRNMRNSYLLQVPVILKHGALVADVPVITAVAAEGFGLRADEPRVHDLGKVVVGLAEAGQTASP